MKNYDIVIVGGGPGGSMCAKIAAEKGLKAIFFERGRKPGEKNSSGCGLGPRMFRDWPDMMKELTPDKCPSLRAGKYARNYLVNKDDEVAAMILAKPTESVEYEPAKSFITMNCYRSDFDPWIANLAVNAGAELMNSTLIVDLFKENGKTAGVIDEKGEKYKAPIVIGADGVVSTVAKKTGLRDKWDKDDCTLVPQYDFYVPRENIDRILGDEVLGVWWGVNFPSAYQVFFGDGFHIGLGNWMGNWKYNPLYYLNRVVGIKHFQHLIKMLDAKPREVQAHLLPWMTYPKNTHTDNVMLIGDAGGFPCPLEAEGIYPAMVTGKIAAEVAAEAISAGDTSKGFLNEYDKRWQATSVGKEFEAGKELVRVWRALPFSLNEKNNMEWFIPLIAEAIGGIFDWSQPHTVRLRQIVTHISELLPEAMPTLMKEFMPLFQKVGLKRAKFISRFSEKRVLKMLQWALKLTDEGEKKKKEVKSKK